MIVEVEAPIGSFPKNTQLRIVPITGDDQIEDISYIRQAEGFDNLPDSLKCMAEARLSHPEASLTELGGLLDPPVGKSGVNHRLRKLSEYADALRAKERL